MEDKMLPEVVYKYRTWTKEFDKKMLKENELFFASPRSFNDPFDCKIPANFSLLDTNEKIDLYLKAFITRQEHNIIANGLNREYEIGKLRNRITNEPAKLQSEYEQILFEGIDKCYGIFSLSERWDSILMWSHYADNHKGYCVGFYNNKLKGLDIVTGKGVSYPSENTFPIINPINNNAEETLMLEVYSKSNEWEYEKEFRLSILNPDGLTDEQRKRKVTDDYFAEIIIGLNTPESDAYEILAIAKEKKIKAYKIKKVPFKFEVEREEIV